MANSAFVVLGASSWIGHYLLPALRRIAPHAKIIALYRNRTPTFDSHAEVVSAIEPLKIIRDLSSAIGKRAPFLLSVRLHDLFPKPLTEVRQICGIV
jgi:hypothetical protein